MESLGIGIWIDHAEAILVRVFSNGSVKTRRLQSELDPVRKPSIKGGRHSGRPYEFTGRHLATHSEAKYNNQLRDYYKKVIAEITATPSVLVLGPGITKKQLASEMKSRHRFQNKNISVKNSEQLTVPQLEAQVKKHFGIKIPRKLDPHRL